MAKNASKNEIVETIYGINRKTFAVESVSCTRGNVLSSWRNGNYFKHPIHPAGTPESEVAIVFDLIELVRVPQVAWSAEYAREVREKLEARAAEMKKEAERSS